MNPNYWVRAQAVRYAIERECLYWQKNTVTEYVEGTINGLTLALYLLERTVDVNGRAVPKEIKQ